MTRPPNFDAKPQTMIYGKTSGPETRGRGSRRRTRKSLPETPHTEDAFRSFPGTSNVKSPKSEQSGPSTANLQKTFWPKKRGKMRNQLRTLASQSLQRTKGQRAQSKGQSNGQHEISPQKIPTAKTKNKNNTSPTKLLPRYFRRLPVGLFHGRQHAKTQKHLKPGSNYRHTPPRIILFHCNSRSPTNSLPLVE